MEDAHTISSIGSLIGDPTRAIVLSSLLNGDAWSAGELARAAGVTPQTISSHLALLVDAGLLGRAVQGRHRYYRLAKPEIANMLESLTSMATSGLRKPKREIRVAPAMRHARTCYDHLAGGVAVAIVEAMIARDLIDYGDRDFTISDKGRAFFDELDIDCDALARQKRGFALQCLDWTERRYHLAGSLGAELLNTFNRKRWISRVKGTRAMRVTRSGQTAFSDLLGIRL